MENLLHLFQIVSSTFLFFGIAIIIANRMRENKKENQSDEETENFSDMRWKENYTIKVSTPPMVHLLPYKSTVSDLAFKINSEIGVWCTGAIVNNKYVRSTHPLQDQDIVNNLFFSEKTRVQKLKKSQKRVSTPRAKVISFEEINKISREEKIPGPGTPFKPEIILDAQQKVDDVLGINDRSVGNYRFLDWQGYVAPYPIEFKKLDQIKNSSYQINKGLIDSEWNVMLGKYVLFKKMHGRFPVDDDCYSLWAENQKINFHKLTQAQQNNLLKINPEFLNDHVTMKHMLSYIIRNKDQFKKKNPKLHRYISFFKTKYNDGSLSKKDYLSLVKIYPQFFK